MGNVSTCSGPTTVFVMTASLWPEDWRKAALTMVNASWTSITATPSLSVRIPTDRMTASAGKVSLEMDSTVRWVRSQSIVLDYRVKI